MPNYRPKWLPNWSRKLVKGTSRTKYCSPKDVGATVHSYRGAKPVDLATTDSRYPSQKLSCVTIVAGFNDNSSTVSDFAKDWRFLIILIIHKFNPNVLIIPKTILSANNHFTNRQLGALNNSLFRLFNTFYYSRIRIISPNLNVNFSANMFCEEGIHFSFYGNKIFSLLLAQLTCINSAIKLPSSLPNYGRSNGLPYL